MKAIKNNIERFWKGTLPYSSMVLLLDYLEKQDPGWESTLRAEYDQPAEEEVVLSDGKAVLLLEQLHEKMRMGTEVLPKRSTIHFSAWAKRTVAAVLFLSSGLALYTYERRHAQPSMILDAGAEKWITVHNATTTILQQQLPDSSLVTLQPHSTMMYNKSFGDRIRNINLEGAAKFVVHKDAVHPFRVTAKGFTTTALGTVFEVNTLKDSTLCIKLLEGKIVVHADRATEKIKDAYLLPGDKFIVNTITHKVQRSIFITAKDSLPATRKAIASKGEKEKKLVFNKEPLQQVLKSLGKWYNVNIVFDTTEMQGLSFTGAFKSDDVLDITLSAVCNMNGLSFSKQQGVIIINKEK